MKISARVLKRAAVKHAAAIRQYAADDRGEVAIEYGLIVGFISIAIVATVTSIGTTLRDDFFNAIVQAFGGGGDGGEPSS